MAITAAVNSDGFEWRILLGPTHNWTTPQLELSKDVEGLCHLCGESIDNGKPFVTNSAGEEPTHIACLSEPKPASTGLRPAQKLWAHLMQCFVSS
jgi:hypothetical protein